MSTPEAILYVTTKGPKSNGPNVTFQFGLFEELETILDGLEAKLSKHYPTKRYDKWCLVVSSHGNTHTFRIEPA